MMQQSCSAHNVPRMSQVLADMHTAHMARMLACGGGWYEVFNMSVTVYCMVVPLNGAVKRRFTRCHRASNLG
jgi:hypothetical protein